MFEQEAEEARNLYDKLYSQGYPPSEVQYLYWPWVRGYFAFQHAANKNEKRNAILDVGCGRQAMGPLFDAAFPSYLYIGLDVAPSLKPFFCCSAHQIPLHDDGISFLWSCDFIEHVQESMVEKCLGEMARVMRDRGFISAATEPSGRRVGGKNLHLTIRDENWWRKTLAKFFLIDDIWSPKYSRYGYLVRKKRE